MKSLLLSLLLLPLGTFAQQLPDFAFSKLDGQDYFTNMVPRNQPVLVYYFDPYCENCEKQIDLIMGDKGFSSITMIFVSLEDPEALASFAREHLPVAPNIVVAIDMLMLFDSVFGYSEFGTMYCYNAQHQLVQTFTEPVQASTILNSLR